MLEGMALGWNVLGVAVLAIAAHSVALAGFGIDSLIEIAASAVVIWELRGTDHERQRLALRMIGVSFLVLACYLAAQSTLVLVIRYRPNHSTVGMTWTALTVVVMVLLAADKERTGRRLDNPVLRTEGRVTLVDAVLAATVLVGLVLNAFAGWWWADPLAGYVILLYGIKEGWCALHL
jgi:divalent metal cation (Fe/Co/Zn/Cd) transporter